MAKDKGEKRPSSHVPDRGKQPRSEVSIDQTRTPRSIPVNPRARNPVWAFRIVDTQGPWGWSRMDGQRLGEVLERFKAFESMTWQEIDGPTGGHGVEVSQLCKEAQNRLAEIRQDDADVLFSLRLTGKRRVWGILEEHVYKVLWWDPEHEVCPSKLKHT